MSGANRRPRPASRAASRIRDPKPPLDHRAVVKASFDALQDGRFAEARQVLLPLMQGSVAEYDFETRLLIGLTLAATGEPLRAAPLLNAIAAERPQSLHPCMDLSTLLHKQQRRADAEPAFHACLELTPDDARLRLGLAQLLNDLYRFDEALREIDRSIADMPGYHPSRNQRAIILAALGRTDEALAEFRHVVAEDAGNSAAWANIGCTLAAEGAFEEALSAYRRSIQLKPAEPQVRLNHSICLLKAGRMVQGWHEHEWRLRLPGHTQLPIGKLLPNLTPRSDFTGRTILVTHEEGIGDTLMYLRYVPLLSRLGAKVIVWVPQNLARLCARVEGVSGVIVADQVTLEADWHCPFISLPRAFAGTEHIWGQLPPYLHTDPGCVAEAASRLPKSPRIDPLIDPLGYASIPKLRVGLVWGGAPRPEFLAANAIDRKRSTSLRQLAPLAGLRHVELVSLQHGPYAAELNDPPAGLSLFDPMATIEDMDDTANLIRNLDVVVTVDTSIVHLAGGLGVPTILMDRYDNCWRWFHDREDSPWYPSVRIVRQKRQGDWAGVVARVLPMLQQMANAKRTGSD
ncbi:tetratricopeptide repeat protein [Lichenicola sp.]|uniref:tetratricopeptide repeat protein n=1 Tax=Lichenicola sp. TaxID=2804529 RepID=UPI003AFF8828